MPGFTKKAIAQSFMKLLNERPLDKITVKDIVEDCGVNRNTFYYYYQDIYALLEDIFETEASLVINKHKPYNTWLDGFLESAKFALDNKKAVLHIFNSINRNQLDRYLNTIVENYMVDFVKRKAEGLDVSDEDIRIVAVFFKHAIVGVTIEWIQGGMKEDFEVFIVKMANMLEGSVKYILSKTKESRQ